MNKRKTGLCLFSGLFLSLAVVYLLFPFQSSASDDKNSKKNSLQKSSSAKFAAPSNYDAFLNEPLKFAEDVQRRESADTIKKTQFEARLGVPTFVWADGGGQSFKPQSSKAKNADAARETALAAAGFYLGEHAAQYRLGRADLASLEPTVHDTGRGAIIVKFKQNIDGVEVFRDELGVLMNRQYELIAISGYVTGVNSQNGFTNRSFELQPETAVAVALGDLSAAPVDSSALNRQTFGKNASKSANEYISFNAANEMFSGFSVNDQTLRAKKFFYHLADGFVPAYYVEANIAVAPTDESKGGDLYFSYVVSALDGRILFRNNLTAEQEVSHRVFADSTPPFSIFDGPQGNSVTPHPTGQPDNFSPGYAVPNLVTLQNSPFSRNDPWLPLGAFETRGNNADAYADLVAPDGFSNGDVRATMTAPGVFDRSFDPSAPRTDGEQRMFAVDQLFFNVNYLHDDFYDSGFNEISGNAQNDNFGRGGLGNDRMRAEAQDYSGRNNANMNTPADGAQPRMQMYIFDAPALGTLNVLSPSSIAGTREVGVATGFGPQSFDVTGTIAIAADGTAPATDACTALVNGAEITGKIAFIDRGSCDFTLKVRNAQNAGAIGVIIADNVAGSTAGLGGTATDITIPAVRITLAEGNVIRAQSNVVARMFRAPASELDGTLDNQIVAHEWGHYISNRLISNSNGLVNNQGRAMGEGWGDFHSLLMTVREQDINVPSNANWNGVYAMAGYATGHGAGNSYYFGIRRLPYSTDFNKNPLSFRHISDGVALPTNVPIKLNGLANSQVHNSGEVWGSMLWDCYVSLLRAHPFQEARDRMKFYLVSGYKMTPVSPTYVEARNAIMAAAAANDPADMQRFAAAFTKRGMGVRAVAPDRASTNHSGVVESTINGPDLAFVSGTVTDTNGDRDGYLDGNETGTVTVTIRNVGFQSVSGATATISSSNPALIFPNGTSFAIPSSNPFGSDVTATVAVSAGMMSGLSSATFTVTLNVPNSVFGAPTGSFTERLNADEQTNVATIDNVETRQTAWTLSRDTSLDPNNNSKWQMVRPNGGVTNQLWYGPDAGFASDIYLVSPTLIVGSTGGFSMRFKHSYDFETDRTVNPNVFYDGGVIEMSLDNGATWTDIGASAYTGTLTNYEGNLNPLGGRAAFVGTAANVATTLNVASTGFSSFAPGSAVKVRFRIGTDFAVGGGGWQVDDIQFDGISNRPFAVLTADLAPTAANVSVSGRVVSPSGTAVSGATVSITDAAGNSRTVKTGSFGHFSFENISGGETYVLGVKSKRYQFAPQIISTNDDVADLVFTALE